MTRQSFAKDADINVIMSRYPNGGVPLDAIMQGQPIFGDFSDVHDFGAMVNRVQQARDNFMLLPAETRVKFDNNVESLLTFINDPKNVIEAVRLQLLPESMIEATFAVRPDLRPLEGEYSKKKVGAAASAAAGQAAASGAAGAAAGAAA